MSHPSVFAAAALAVVAVVATPAPAKGRDLLIHHAWVRPTPPAAPAGAGYLTITNKGVKPDRLLAGSSPWVREVQVHEMKLDGDVMRMRPVPGGIPVPAGGSVTLAPGGYHLMLIGLKRPFVAGGRVPVTLRFARGGTMTVSLPVRMTPPVEGEAR